MDASEISAPRDVVTAGKPADQGEDMIERLPVAGILQLKEEIVYLLKDQTAGIALPSLY
jgi:hypothetical protein